MLQAEAKHIDLQVPLMVDGWCVLCWYAGSNRKKNLKNVNKSWHIEKGNFPEHQLVSAHIALLF